MEDLIVYAAIVLAAGFVGWRAWRTLRASRAEGKSCGGSCACPVVKSREVSVMREASGPTK